MALLNQNFMTFGGTPVTGRIPARIIHLSGPVMNAVQHGVVAHAYNLFCSACQVALGNYQVQNRRYPDGMTVRMERNSGQDRVWVRTVGGGEEAFDMYMESGYLSWVFPHPDNPARLNPATWHFMDIGTSEKFLGWITSDPLGEQKNDPLLSEGMNSRAIGAPVDPDPVKNQQNMLDYEGALLVKKIVCAYFKPSLFSGKLRKFVQAQYGALMTPTSFKFTADAVGTELVLRYINGEGNLQFCYWSHSCQGLITDAYGNYWIAGITNYGGTITIYPVVSVGVGNKILKKLKAARAGKLQLTADQIDKLESYYFAHCVIEADKGTVVGGLAIPLPGFSLAYGWKWKHKSNGAKIILHNSLDPDSTEYRWRSNTITLSFSCGKNSQKTRAENITATVTLSQGSEWTDGWGDFNIFAPGSVTSPAPLTLVSAKTQRPFCKPDFDFSGVPIYGYFDKDDQWVEAKISKHIPQNPGVTRKYSFGGANYYRCPESGEDFWNAGAIYLKASGSFVGVVEDTSRERGMTLDIDGVGSIQGYYDYGTFGVITQGQTTKDEYVHGVSVYEQGGGPYCTLPESELDPRPYDYTKGGYNGTVSYYSVSNAQSGSKARVWAFIVPCGDCESMMMADHTRYFAQTWNTTTATQGRSFFSTVRATYDPAAEWEIERWIGGPGPGSGAILTSSNTYVGPTYDVSLTMHSSTFGTKLGEFAGSAEPLFIVDKDYPYYARGIQMVGSAGGRYYCSEGARSPPTVPVEPIFFGWA